MKVKIYRINKDNHLPNRANDTDAGYDVYSSESVNFEPGETKLVPLGIIAQAPKGFHFKLFLRSSMALKRGFRLANAVGIIDHLYSGENDEFKAIIQAPIKWDAEIKIQKGERVGQLMLEKNVDIEWIEQEDRDFAGSKSRGGFGSTGK